MKKDLSPVYDLIRADGSIVINKALCFAIGLEETIVYSELLSRYNYFNIREDLDDEGYFFNTIDDFQRATTLNDKEQKKSISKLERLGLIKTKLKGLPAKRHFMIIDDLQLLLNYIDAGKKRIEALEKIQKEEMEKSLQQRKQREEARQSQLNQQFLQNGETCLEDVAKQEQPNQLSNNTKPNDTNFNYTNSKEGSFRDEVREGTVNSTPYYDYLSNLLKQCKSKYKSEILESIIYYYSKYYKKFKVEHTRYTKRYCLEIIDRLDTLFLMGIHEEELDRYLDVNLEQLKEMINKHFETVYKNNKYTMLSFLNDNILKNRYHEVIY